VTNAKACSASVAAKGGPGSAELTPDRFSGSESKTEPSLEAWHDSLKRSPIRHQFHSHLGGIARRPDSNSHPARSGAANKVQEPRRKPPAFKAWAKCLVPREGTARTKKFPLRVDTPFRVVLLVP